MISAIISILQIIKTMFEIYTHFKTHKSQIFKILSKFKKPSNFLVI